MNDLNSLIMFDKFSKFSLICIVIIFLVIFGGTLIKVQQDTKEANCITYYSSLGYTANGCEKYIERFMNANE